MIKACVFDLDGTLADTIESLTYSVGETLKEMGLDNISKEECQSFVGNGARRLIELSVTAAGGDETRFDEAMEIYGRIFDDNCTYHVTPYAGVSDILEQLKRKGIRLAVLSNKPHKQTVKVIETMFGKGTFDVIFGQQENVARKPDPEGVYLILEELGVSNSECLYIGDSEVDIATGNNAGTKTVGVMWGFRTLEELKKAGAEYVIRKPEDLIEYILW